MTNPIRSLQSDTGLSMHELAEALDMSYDYIRKIRSGHYKPSRLLVLIARAVRKPGSLDEVFFD